MKKPNYIIKINKPCQENWDEMTQNDKGKHCAVCAKTVVDFSKLSDNQVIKLIENSKGEVCGHFNKTQLNRALTQTNEQTNPFLYQILAGALLLSSCDTTPKETPNIEVVSTLNNDKKSSQTEKSVAKEDSLKLMEIPPTGAVIISAVVMGALIIESDDRLFKKEMDSLSKTNTKNNSK